jgi:hypothetical protein
VGKRVTGYKKIIAGDLIMNHNHNRKRRRKHLKRLFYKNIRNPSFLILYSGLYRNLIKIEFETQRRKAFIKAINNNLLQYRKVCK